MKPKTVFSCQECGAQSQKWLGTLSLSAAPGTRWSRSEQRKLAAASSEVAKRYSLAATAGPQLYAEIDTVVAERLTTGIDEFDRVLGGGVVPGSLVLIGGEPGIGKSTLLLQAAAHFAQTFGPVLYSSGEESEHQIKSRGERLGIDPSTRSGSSQATSSDQRAPLYILAETCLERILEEIARLKPAFIIVDSIQTVFSLRFQSAPGSIGQVREAATQLLFAAKGQNIPDVPRRPRDEGWQHCRAQGARAHRRHGAVLRRRETSRASRRARGEEPVRSGERARRVRDDRPRAPRGSESVETVSRRTAGERARLRGVVLRRRIASDAGRDPGARQHEHLRQRAPDDERPRSQSPVTVARGAREAGRA